MSVKCKEVRTLNDPQLQQQQESESKLANLKAAGYVKVTLGHNHYRCSVGSRRLDFNISHHGHLFWTLQLDLYERKRMLMGPVHWGRGFLRLSAVPEGRHSR